MLQAVARALEKSPEATAKSRPARRRRIRHGRADGRGPRVARGTGQPSHRSWSASLTRSTAIASFQRQHRHRARPARWRQFRRSPHGRRPCALRRQGDGRGTYRFYHRAMNEEVNDRRQIEMDLREAIEQQRAGTALSADHRPAAQRHHRLRGAGAMAPSGQGHGAAGGVHSGGRGQRAHPAARRVGAAGGLQQRGHVARASEDRRQPFAGAVLRAQSVRNDRSGARGNRPGAAPARARNHRADIHGQQREDVVDPAPPEAARRLHRDGRFRDRILVAQLSAQLPVRQDQGGPRPSSPTWPKAPNTS